MVRMNQSHLRRRVHLGLDLGVPSDRVGARVLAAHPGGPGHAAGIREGDLVTHVGEHRVNHPSEVAAACRDLADGTAIRVHLERDGQSVEAVLSARARPAESVPGGTVVLGEVRSSTGRLRTVATVPEGEGPRPAVLLLQGIDTASCERPLDPMAPVRRLVADWTSAGYATMRVERSGVGDSEGPPPEETDLEAEIEGVLAAFDALVGADGIDPRNVFLFGHSIGGMIAPIVASQRSVRGVMVFGTSAKRWRTCAVGTTERQLALKGYTGEALEARLAAWAEMHAAVCRDGLTPAEAMARRPHLSMLASRQCGGDALFRHHARFFRQLDAAQLAARWAAIDVPVLVLRGEHDWVCDASDAASVVVACGGRAAVQLEELAGIGHDQLAHASLEAAFERPREGRWDGQVSAAAVDWMHRERPSD